MGFHLRNTLGECHLDSLIVFAASRRLTTQRRLVSKPLVDFSGYTLGMRGDFGNSHQFANAAARQRPADENAVGRSAGSADRTALAVGRQAKANRV
ncbi:MAG: hypothetical protein E5W85_30900 [Mesorhizobium sp.]|nr:MAG: hypothetical protein E5W85_30900 [Mesorhizobium sp.]